MIQIQNNWIIVNNGTEKRKTGYIHDGAYYTPRYRKKHFYHRSGGYPIDFEVLDWLERRGIDNIVIIEKCLNGDKFFKATVAQYLKGEDINWTFGFQKNVPLKELEEIKNGRP